MVCAKLGNQLGGVLAGVDGEGLWDDKEGIGEFCNRKLLTRSLHVSETWSATTWEYDTGSALSRWGGLPVDGELRW